MLHGGNVDDSSVRVGSAGPGIVQLILIPLFLVLIGVPLYPPRQQPIEYFVDLHLLPFRWHEVPFGRRMGAEGEGVVVLELDLVLLVGYGLRGHLSASDPVDELELLVREPDVPLVELVPDGPPPILVLRFLDELGYHVVLLLFGHLLQVLIVSEMFQLIIPSVGNAPDLHLRLLVLLVIGVLLAEGLLCLPALFLLPLGRRLRSASLHASPII